MDSLTVTEKEKKIEPRANLDVEKEEKKPEKEAKKDVKEEKEEEIEEVEEVVATETAENPKTFEPEIVHTAFTQEMQDETSDFVEEEEKKEFANEEYIKSFENRTIDDFLKEEQEKEKPEKEPQKEEKEQEPKDTRSLKEYFADLRRARAQEENQEEKSAQSEETKAETSATEQTNDAMTIEKPNYDLIEPDKKVIKISQKKKNPKKKSKKAASIALAIALGVSGVICITNCVLIDQQYSAYVEIGDTYELNLQKYLRNISNLDATKKSMEVIETYPEEVNDAGDLGESSNWFDRICNFLSGLFGG